MLGKRMQGVVGQFPQHILVCHGIMVRAVTRHVKTTSAPNPSQTVSRESPH
jgi:hypothetical protein